MFSRGFAALTLVGGLVLAQMFGGVMAAQSKVANHPGKVQEKPNTAWQIVCFPLRLVTGATGLAIGAFHGSVKGIVSTEEQFAMDTFGQAEQNPLLVPVGLVGTVAAVPVGIFTGAPKGASEGGQYGYHLWDQL